MDYQASSQTALQLALASAALMGLRHGFDYDHIAAITDITAAEPSPRRGLRLGMTYAGGHAVMVALIGAAALLLQLRLPERIDRFGELLVGATLIALGAYVVGTLAFGPSDARPKSRAMLLGSLFGAIYSRLRALFGTAPAVETGGAQKSYGYTSSFAVGVVHGIGAETPTQVMIFLLAANLGGVAKGLLGLGIFIAGLFVMNALICLSTTGMFRFAADRVRLNRLLSGVAASFSVLLGVWYLAG